MTEKLSPRPGRVLVQEDKFKYEGLIAIPDKAKRRPTTGIVVAVGKGVEDIPIGQHVLYAQFSGTGIKIKNLPEYRVVTPEEILLFLDKDLEIEEVSA
jgi:co-chaperonin GroES (HSP10)